MAIITPTLDIVAIPDIAPRPEVTVTRAGTATRVNSRGLIEAVAANTIRHDYHPTTGEYLGWLLEESRTNLFVYSEQFDNAAWTKTGATVTTNSAIAPDGNSTADILVETSASTGHPIGQSISLTPGTAVTVSCWVKKLSTNRHFSFVFENSTIFGGSFPSASFNLDTGTVSTTVSGTADIRAFPNGWYRCIFTVTPTGTASSNVQLRLQDATTLTSPTSTYTGNGTSGIYIWGAQIGSGSFPTSYIPTVAASVTRSADIVTMAASSWLNLSEGTFYVMFDKLHSGNFPAFKNVLELNDGTANNRIIFAGNNASTEPYPWMVAGGVDQTAYAGLTSAAAEVMQRGTLAYATNSLIMRLGTIATTEDTSITIPSSLTTLNIGSNFAGANVWNGHIRHVAYFPRRLTNADLQALTL